MSEYIAHYSRMRTDGYAPWGALIGRYGAPRIMLAGLGLLALHVAIALSGVGLLYFASALICLGVGWNFSFVGATALLTEV